MAKVALSRISNPAFTKAMQDLLQKALPIRAAWQVKSLTNKFNEELKKYAELRKEILERYANKGEDGQPLIDENNNYTFEKESVEALTKEMSELMAIEVEITPIKLGDLGNIEIAPQQLFDLAEVIDA